MNKAAVLDIATLFARSQSSLRNQATPVARVRAPCTAIVRNALLLLLPLTLVACGGQPPKPAEDATGRGAVLPAPTFEKKPPVVLKRGGGFYQDDGPGDSVPDNLDAVPDAEPRAEPLHRFANNPYSVLGRDYVPMKALQPYRARGVASWYGRKFHGQKTSSGEIYDMFAMTAAHPTLPIPSYVRVTNLANGSAVVVRVNDRGPFLHERLIDLSCAAAWKLGYIGSGSAQVEVESVLPGEDPPPAPLLQRGRLALRRQFPLLKRGGQGGFRPTPSPRLSPPRPPSSPPCRPCRNCVAPSCNSAPSAASTTQRVSARAS